MKLSQFQPQEKPRERLACVGAQNLQDAELLAILLRTGTREHNVLDVARLLLEAAGGRLSAIEAMSPQMLCRVKGIGMDKAVTVAAAMELARRLSHEKSLMTSYGIDSPGDAGRYLQDLYTTDRKEECWAVFLKRSRRILGTMRVSEGGESMTEIDIKNIVRKALDLKANFVILSHNHPSGSACPSKADMRLTEKLREALDTFEVSLMDHIILADDGMYSFSENGMVSIQPPAAPAGATPDD